MDELPKRNEYDEKENDLVMKGNSDKPDMIQAIEEPLNENLQEETIEIDDEDDCQEMREPMMNIDDEDISTANVEVDEITGVTGVKKLMKMPNLENEGEKKELTLF